MDMSWSCAWSERRGAIFRAGGDEPILVQEAPEKGRPYIHPLRSPEGGGVLTENAPGHHPWQHGLYVGLNDVNGVGFWTEGLASNSELDGLFACSDMEEAQQTAESVQWSVACRWSYPDGRPLLDERQEWTWAQVDGAYELDMRWTLTARANIHFGAYDYGGLFLRMPYRGETGGAVLTSEGHAFPEAEGQRARWVAVWMPIAGEPEGAGIAIMDHPNNPEHPVPWRVDNQLGISPSRCIAGAWDLAEGVSTTNCYRVVVFSRAIDADNLADRWERFRSSDE